MVEIKRDMDLVREILLLTSESLESVEANAFVYDQNDLRKVVYTIDIMKEAGLIEACVIKAFGGEYFDAVVHQLTWDGHELLENIKDERVWERVKKTIARTGSSASLFVFEKLAEKIVLETVLGE